MLLELVIGVVMPTRASKPIATFELAVVASAIDA
jgi:hypothetical protein